MPKSKNYGKVVVIMGGDSSEREISLLSGNAVFAALSRCNIDVHRFDYTKTPLEELITQKFDCAVIMLHGKGGEDGTLQGLLECLKIPYTGSGVLASSLAMDKYRTKLMWQACGIPMPKSQYLTKEQYTKSTPNEFELKLPLPVIVKPNYGGSTIGVAIAHTQDDLNKGLTEAFKYDNRVLIEELIIGDEYTVTFCDEKVYPIIKIEIPQHKGSYDYQDKYFTNDTKYICSPNLGALQKSIEEYAKLGYQAIGARGVARIDFMLSKSDQKVYFLEINTIPGMTGHSFVPMAFKAVGIGFDALCLHMLDLARLDNV